MSAFRSLSRAMVLGLLRDRTAVFFTLVFPLMFLALFGALLRDSGIPSSTVVQVGAVDVLDDMPADQRAALSDALTIIETGDRDQALEDVREGEVDAAVWQDAEGRIELRYSAADSTAAGTVQGLMQSIVQGANVAATYWGGRHELLEVVELARHGVLDVAVERFSLDDGVEAYRRMSAGTLTGRAVVIP